jgi:hypothetical protein
MDPGGTDEAEADLGRSRLADLAERLADEIARASPDWCALARDAAELARGTMARCRAGR